MQNLELYLFRTIPSSKKVDIRLDKLTDVYGSPSIDDIERFSRSLYGGTCHRSSGRGRERGCHTPPHTHTCCSARPRRRSLLPTAVLDRELGVEAAGDISFEVSSPGAERNVLLPAELKRFAGLPLKVCGRRCRRDACLQVLCMWGRALRGVTTQAFERL